ncbi:MAG: YhjD/YihY/BrkB family envelope integrity protein [Nocardioidaceae bacterium]
MASRSSESSTTVAGGQGPRRGGARLRPLRRSAAVVWLIASLAFSLYVDNFGNYSKTYGSLAAVVVLLLWMWISFYVVLLGAEVNAESEEQTVRDTTVGPEVPLGQRGAVKADSEPPTADDSGSDVRH